MKGSEPATRERQREPNEEIRKQRRLVKAGGMMAEASGVKMEKWVVLALEGPLNAGQITENLSCGE